MSTVNKDYIVNLISKGENLEVFNDLVKLKELGYANKYSMINFKGVLVPAGLCKDSENFIVTYSAIVSGDHALLFDQISEDLSKKDALYFINICARSLKKQGRDPFDKSDVLNFLQFREKKSKMFQI